MREKDPGESVLGEAQRGKLIPSILKKRAEQHHKTTLRMIQGQVNVNYPERSVGAREIFQKLKGHSRKYPTSESLPGGVEERTIPRGKTGNLHKTRIRGIRRS